MALRVITDLPRINIDERKRDRRLSPNLAESAFEISYLSSPGDYKTYVSRQMLYMDLSGLILDEIANSDFDFYGYKTFYGGIGISNMLNLTGDFLVNVDVDDYSQFSAIINAGDIILNSYNQQLCA